MGGALLGCTLEANTTPGPPEPPAGSAGIVPDPAAPCTAPPKGPRPCLTLVDPPSNVVRGESAAEGPPLGDLARFKDAAAAAAPPSRTSAASAEDNESDAARRAADTAPPAAAATEGR